MLDIFSWRNRMAQAVSMNEKGLRRAITKVFLAFPDNGDSFEENVRVYVEALCRVPIAYVEEACDYAVRGKLSSGKYMPTAGELVQLAEELRARKMRTLGRPRFSWEKYDNGQIYNTPQQRAKIVAGFGRLIADLKGGPPIQPDNVTFRVFRED